MKVALLVFTITLLAAGCYAGRYLEIYSDSNCVDLVAVDWCSECGTGTDVVCSATGGGSSNYYSLSYDYAFAYADDIPSDFARIAYKKAGDCATMDATNVDFTAVNASQLGECLGYYEGSQSAIRISGCDGTNPITFQYYDISSTCSYNSPPGTFSSTCGEIGSTGVFGLGACPNEQLFGIPATPISPPVDAPVSAPIDSTPSASPTASNSPSGSNSPSSNTPTKSTTPVKSSDAAKITMEILAVFALMLF